jgi:biotin transport system substrate-specific component
MNKRIKELSLIAFFPALMGATAGISIPLLGLPPITLQTLFVFLAGMILKPKNAFYSMCIYLLLGVIGIPVFSGYNAGLAVLFGPSGGFLMGFPIIALMTSILKNSVFSQNYFFSNLLVVLIGTVTLYMIGATYITVIYKANIFTIISGFSLYLPGDIIKAFIVSYVYVRVHSFVTYECT